MLSTLLRWRSTPTTPQDDFKKLHATLSTPPTLSPSSLGHHSSPSRAAKACCPITPHANIVDPYHMIICQHGVLSTSADFDNVITDLFVHHEVSVLEAAELAAERAATAAAPPSMSSSSPSHVSRNDPSGQVRRTPPASAAALGSVNKNSGAAPNADLSACVPNTTTPTVTISVTGSASPAAVHPPATYHNSNSHEDGGDGDDDAICRSRFDHAEAPSMSPSGSAQNEVCQTFPCTPHSTSQPATAAKPPVDPLRPDTALTPAQRSRRDDYKKTFHLKIDYPNSTSGRLYRSGNLRVFSPGSNNYLRSDAGTLACAQKMLAEVVPQLQAWLDDVEAQERQRRARWSVFARTVNTPEAARWAAEAARPLPVCLSFMAHSFGGIIERECLYLLLVDSTETAARSPVLYDAIAQLRRRLRENHVTFENFLNIATPHCGAGECLWWPIYFGAWCLARLHLCQTYDELILSDGQRVLQTRLLDAPHLKALELFRRRVLFANTHRDLLVGFGTCSLIFENVETDHTKFVGVSAEQTHCAAAFADDTIEISRPIKLQSFAEEDEAAAAAAAASTLARSARAGFSVGSVSQLGSPASAYTTSSGACAVAAKKRKQRTYTLEELDGLTASALEAAADASAGVSADDASRAGEGGDPHEEGCNDDVDSSNDSEAVNRRAKFGDLLSRTLRPQPTYSTSLSGLTASPLSMTSPAIATTATTTGYVPFNSEEAAAQQDSVFATSLTVGCHVPSHDIPEMTLEEVVGPCGWTREMDEVDEDGEGDSDAEEQNPNAPSCVSNKNIYNAENRACRRRPSTQLHTNQLLTLVVMDPAGASSSDMDATAYGSPVSTSVSPASLHTRSLSVLRGYPGGKDGEAQARLARFTSTTYASQTSTTHNGGGGGSDAESAASSSRRSRGSRIASVLRDPRWAAEHVRHAAATVQTEVTKRLSSTATAAAAVVLAAGSSCGVSRATSCGKSVGCDSEGGLTESSTTTSTNAAFIAAAAAGGAAPLMSTTAAETSAVEMYSPASLAVASPLFSSASACAAASPSLLPSAEEMPQYRQSPRAIAARLRETLSWRVRAVRFDNVIPVGHVACLGNWAFCGTSPMLVQSVAEELLMVLD